MMHSKASAALMRLQELDRKYKAKSDQGTLLRSNVSTESSLESRRSTSRKASEPNSKIASSKPNLEVRIPLAAVDLNSSMRTSESSNETSYVESAKNSFKKKEILNEKIFEQYDGGSKDERKIAIEAAISDNVSGDKWEDSGAFKSDNDDDDEYDNDTDDGTAIDEVISAVDEGSDVITETSRAAAEAETPHDHASTNLASHSEDSEVPVVAPEMYENDTFEDASNSTSASRLTSQEDLNDVKTVSMSSRSEELVDNIEPAVIRIKITPRERRGSPRRKTDQDRDKRVIELVAPKMMEETSECEIGLDEELSNYVKSVESTDRDSDELSPVCLLKPSRNSEALKRYKKTPKKSPRESKKVSEIGELRKETPLPDKDIGNPSKTAKEILEVIAPERKSLVVNLNGHPCVTKSIEKKSEVVTSKARSPMGSARDNSYASEKNLEGFTLESRLPIKNINGDRGITNPSVETSRLDFESTTSSSRRNSENVDRGIKLDKRKNVNGVKLVSMSPREYLEDVKSSGKSWRETAGGNKRAVQSPTVSNREESPDSESFSRIAETVSKTRSPGLLSVSYAQKEKVSSEQGESTSTNTATRFSASSAEKTEDSVARNKKKSEKEDTSDGSRAGDSKNISSEMFAPILKEFEERDVTSVLRKLNRDAIDAMAKRQPISADEAMRRKWDKSGYCRNCGTINSSAFPKVSKENDNKNSETIIRGKHDRKSKRKKSRTNLKGSKSKNTRKTVDDMRAERTVDLESNRVRLREQIATMRLQQEREYVGRDIRELKKSGLEIGPGFIGELSATDGQSPIIKPLDFPKIADYERPDVAEFDSRDQFSEYRERISAIRQWLKDQYILYRDYSSLARTLNAKYVPTSLQDAKKTVRELRKGTIKSR
ncbi:hypothetical protein KM043_012422 [Ampulex compressa]|nr:hypothetical protein KM043_012422 [Ampulex compressa]